MREVNFDVGKAVFDYGDDFKFFLIKALQANDEDAVDEGAAEELGEGGVGVGNRGAGEAELLKVMCKFWE